jgi:cytochrome c oxidase assembly protein subunit 15
MRRPGKGNSIGSFNPSINLALTLTLTPNPLHFARYKLFPEWQQRQNMTMDEFKFIFFWEYAHRMFGRFIGIAFVVPATYFLARSVSVGRVA